MKPPVIRYENDYVKLSGTFLKHLRKAMIAQFGKLYKYFFGFVDLLYFLPILCEQSMTMSIL
jgi:hypothetical protein